MKDHRKIGASGLVWVMPRCETACTQRIAERSIRGVTIGRRNWLFAGSEEGGHRAARILSIIETCKLSGIEPEAYIADVMEKIADDWPASRWDELMPWNWTPKSGPALEQAA